LKILQINNLYRQRGGEEIVADSEASLLRKGGHEVDRLLVRNPDRPLAATRLLAAAPWNVAQERSVKRRIRESRPEVVHVHNTWFALSPSIIHGLHDEGVPIVMSLHNYRPLCANASLFRDGRVCTDCVGSHPWWGVLHRCYRASWIGSTVAAATIAVSRARRTWDLVSRFVAPSEFVKRMFVAAGFPADRLTVNPHGVADPGPRAQPPSASRTLLYVGRLTPLKGIRVLLEAWQRASASIPDLELALLGDGPIDGDLAGERFDRVRFLGWADTERVMATMLSARALLVPSQWYEVFGRVAIEAFAAGLPVMASNIGGLGELVSELGAEWVVEPDDCDAWATALARLREDPTVDTFGCRARDLYERHYTPEIELFRLIQVYGSVVPFGEHGPGGRVTA
jgi:glycosyltransferase involved in cell wall biosynthesis